MKNLKKILASLLVVVMVLTAAPLSGFVGLELPDFDFGIKASALSSSGSCGPNVTYTYNSSTGELVISGTGSMTDYLYTNSSPFYKSNIKSVVIEDGVTTIGSYAFINCTSLTSVTIGDSVTSIGWYAFSGCDSLTSITIPDSVTSIGNDAFYKCTSLESVTIPDSITSIGSSAFYNTAYYNNSSNWENNVLYIGNHLIEAKESLSGSYTIKEGTKCIADDAFYNCDNLTIITIPDSVTSIGYYIFSGCTSLETLTIGSGLKEIPAIAFQNLTALKTVNLSEGLEKIGSYAFSGCTYLETINIPDSVTFVGVEILKNTAWFNCRGKGLIVLDGWVYGYKGSDDNITVTFDETVKNIAMEAFKNRDDIVAFKVDENNLYFLSENGVLFNKDKTELINAIASNMGSAYAIPDTVEVIHSDAFYNCNSLYKITIPASVKTIGTDAFYCSNNYFNRSVYIRDLEAWCEIDFANYAANPLSYSGGTLYINNSEASSIAIPDTITEIKPYTFYNCDSLTSVTIPDSVTTIGNYAFHICNNLTSVTLGDSVTAIGEYAFSYCTSLTNVTIPDSVTAIGECAFSYCRSLSNVTIPDSVTAIGEYAFYNCTSLSNIIIGDSVTAIGEYAFSYCTSLSNIIIGDSVTAIGEYAFSYCTSLSNVTIPNSVTAIGSNIVNYCKSLETLSIGSGLKVIPAYAFSELTALKTVNLSEGIEKISNSAFYNCDSLTSITLSDSVTTIGERAFQYCSNLTSITLSKDLQTIGYRAFEYCSKLRDVFYPGSQEDWDKVSIGSWNEPLTNADLFLMHKHDYTVTVTKEPTCTTAGEALYTCVHGDTKIEVIQPLGHSWDEGKITADSSCSKGGTKTYTCTVCFEKKYETIATLEHDFQLRDSYAPTCEKIGYDVYVCTQCSATETRETAPALGHDFSTEFTVDIDSTCTATGIKSKHCKRTGCKETTEETVIPLKDHAWQSEVTVTKVPTCTAEGESVILCKDCKIVKPESNKVIAPLGHNASEQEFTVDIKATCVSFGKQSKHCTRCNYIEQATQIPMSEHDYYVAEESTATCDKPGIAIYVCRMCKDSYTVENSPALGHDFEYIIIETPTCTREGYEYSDCTRCDATETRPVPTIHHDYVRTEVSPTCLDDGLATYTCSYGCGKTYDEVIPALGHSYPAVWIELLPATCTERGLSVKICSVCSDLQRQILPKLAHADNDGDGACDECGYGKETPDTPDTPTHSHKYSTSVTITPTCEVKGEMKFTCDCGDSYTKEIDALGHIEVIDEAVEATCSSTGLTEGSHCDICGKVIIEQEVIAELGHSDGDGDDICDLCNKTITVIDPDEPETPDEPEEEHCDCDCHAGGIKAFFFKLINFFAKIFDKDARTCKCGKSH